MLLSKVFPGGAEAPRNVYVRVNHGEPVSVEGYGLFARCLQHEVGHLDGFLYTDGLIGRNRKAAKRHIRDAGWGVAGRSWDPAPDPDPVADEDADDHDDANSLP